MCTTKCQCCPPSCWGCACLLAESASPRAITSGGRHVVGRNQVFPPFGGEDDESNNPRNSSTKAEENEVCKNVM